MHYFRAFLQLRYFSLFLLGVVCFPSKIYANVWPVIEKYQSDWNDVYNLDSLAVWHGTDDQQVLATAKGKHQIIQLDATSGVKIGEYGKKGTSIGDLNYPNGIAVFGDLAVIVERDNHRVQIFSIPNWKSLGIFGEAELIKPYGLTIVPRSNSEFTIYVTDNYLVTGTPVPYMPELGRRVKQYEVEVGDGRIHAQYIRSFGENHGDGALFEVESILADSENGVLYIADEMKNDIKIYTFDGVFTHRILGQGFFHGEPEGIVLYSCPDGSGYVVLTDQNEKSAETNQFHIFDRRTNLFLGTFFGPNTLNTDGIALDQRVFSSFDHGTFFALNNDGGVSAFDWQEVMDTLGLKSKCSSSSILSQP
jgi:3-phytase